MKFINFFNKYVKILSSNLRNEHKFKMYEIYNYFRNEFLYLLKKYDNHYYDSTIREPDNQQKEKIYLLLYAIITLIIMFFLINYLINNPQCDSNQIGFLMSTISGALASLFAITFSIILIGSQMASRFGIRITKFIFNKKTFMYMCFFIFSIILALINLKQPTNLIANLSIIFATLCLIFLPPYLWFVKRNFNPLTILDKLKNNFSKELNYILKSKVYNKEFFPTSLKSMDNLIMLSFNEKDFDTFKNGLSYLYGISIYLEVLKQKYHRDYYNSYDSAGKNKYRILIRIKLEIEKRINEIRLSLNSEPRASRFIFLSSISHVFELLKLLDICEKNELFIFKRVFTESIKNMIQRMRNDFILQEISKNDFLKEEIFCQLRYIEIELIENKKEAILFDLNKMLTNTLFSIIELNRDDRDDMIIRILNEIFILGALINSSKESRFSLILLDIVKLFKSLGTEACERIYVNSLETVKLEIPELENNLYLLKQLITKI